MYINFMFMRTAFTFTLVLLSYAALAQNNRYLFHLTVMHADTLVPARVSLNGQPVPYDKEEEQYGFTKKQLKKKRGIVRIERHGYLPYSFSLQQGWKDHGKIAGHVMHVRMRHPWDSVYLLQGHEAPLKINDRFLLVLQSDSATLHHAIAGTNLWVYRGFDYCTGWPGGSRITGTGNRAWLLEFGYGTPVPKGNSSMLQQLREKLGADNVGPVILQSPYPLILTHRLELKKHPGTTMELMEKILQDHGLRMYYRDGHNANYFMVEAVGGMGAHITGIAHRLKATSAFEMVGHVLGALICDTR